jgi:Flp pilus assembly protein TadG
MLKFKKLLPLQKANRSGRSRSRRGAAMIEFAIVLPMLLLMILGIIEMGRVMMINQITTTAVRAASRRAIIPGMTNAHVLNIANNYLDGGGISKVGRDVKVLDDAGRDITSLVLEEEVQSHGAVTIEVQVPYLENTWGFTAIAGKTAKAVSRSTMRRE